MLIRALLTLWDIVSVPFLPLRTPSAMIDHIDLYVVGFSVLSFYVLKVYLETREVWKRYK